MLTIREEQMAVFKYAAEKRFEKDTAARLQEAFPLQYKILGERAASAVVHYGIQRAREFGLQYDYEIRCYLYLIFMVGHHFTDDPQFPWARNIHSDETITYPGDKIDLIYKETLQFLDRVAGDENNHLNNALLRIREYPWTSWPGETSGTFEQQISGTLEQIYPEKYRELREQGSIPNLIGKGRETASRYGVVDDWGIMVFIVLMFMLGSAFDTDPQYPWAQNTLNNQDIQDPTMRVTMLYRESMSYLDSLLELISTGKDG